MKKPKKINKVKFLHVADTHLDIKRYSQEERTEDFFMALFDVFSKYAVKEKVKFVLVVGDVFDKKTVSAEGISQAVQCFQLLKDADIPCIVIAGNHDVQSSDSAWLRILSKWKFIHLLEPEFEKGAPVLKPWNEESRTGGYIDIGSFRIYGNIWYGSSASSILIAMLDSIRLTYEPEKFNIMLLHTEIDGINKYIKGITAEQLIEFKKYLDYIALGHIHQNFVIADIAHSPGSLEACSVDQFSAVRGAYLVEVEGKKFKAELKRDYRQRPIVRLEFDLQQDKTSEEFYNDFFSFLRKEITPHVSEVENLAPVLEIIITGTIGFKASLLNLNKIRDEVKKEFRPLLVILKNHTIPVDISSPVSDNLSRGEKEKQIVANLVSKNPKFQNNSEKISDVILEIKRLALSGESAQTIVETIERNI